MTINILYSLKISLFDIHFSFWSLLQSSHSQSPSCQWPDSRPYSMQFFFSLKLIWGEPSWGFPRENWTDSYGHSEQPTTAQSFHKMPNPKCWSGTDLQLCGTVNHLEGGSYCNGTHWGHVWTQPSSTTQEASHEMLATFLQGLQGVTEQQRKNKKTKLFFKDRICWLKCLWHELDGSDELITVVFFLT